MYYLKILNTIAVCLLLIPTAMKAQVVKTATSAKKSETKLIKQSSDPLSTKFYSKKELDDIKIKAPEKAKLIDDFEKVYEKLKEKTKKIYTKDYLWYWYAKDKEMYELLIEKIE